MNSGRTAPSWGWTVVLAAFVATLFAAPAIAGHGTNVRGVQTPLVDITAARDVIDAGAVDIEATPVDPISRGASGGFVSPSPDDGVVTRPLRRGNTTTLAAVSAATDTPAAKARDLIVGNSMTGFSNGAWWTEYYAPDGTIRGVWRSTAYSAKWAMVGNTMCFQYPGRKDSCLLFSVTDDRALFYREDGSGGRQEFKLLPGNPKDL